MGLGGLSYPNESHLKLNKKKIKPNDRIGRIPYNPMRSYTILPFLQSYYDFKLFGEVELCDFTIWIAILTTMIVPLMGVGLFCSVEINQGVYWFSFKKEGKKHNNLVHMSRNVESY